MRSISGARCRSGTASDNHGALGTAILETAMFARSHDSPGIWAADLIAFNERRLRGLYEPKRLAPVHLG